MRIALVWQGVPQVQVPLTAMTVRFDLYVSRLTRLGHQVAVYCQRGLETGFPHPTSTFGNVSDLRSVAFWRSIEADRVLMITWLHSTDILAAARAAGHTIIALADVDGQASARLFFRSRLRRDWLNDPGGIARRLDLIWYYLKLRTFRWRSEDRVFITSVELCERVVFASEGGRRNFARCLRLHSRDDLISKLIVIPYPIDPAFIGNSGAPRVRRAIAIGRWDSPQKNVTLLAGALRTYLGSGGDWEFVVVGRGGSAVFSELQRRFPRFRYIEWLAPKDVADLMKTSQVLVCTSWWEGGSLVVFEALAAGCTIVTTPVPTTAALLEDGLSGTVSKSHAVSALTEALRREFEAWDTGKRPQLHSSEWQDRVGTAEGLALLFAQLPQTDTAVIQ